MQVSRETEARLETYLALLLRWSARINLLSTADRKLDHAALWQRHIVDCLQLLPYLPPDLPRALDLGSGAGLPGLVLAIAADIPFTLIESDQRKAAFLREAARATNAPATILASRIESAAIAPAPLITARALAPLPRLLPLAAPLLAPGGILLLLKGANAAAELTQAAGEWQMQVTRRQSRTDPAGVILIISELQRVPLAI